MCVRLFLLLFLFFLLCTRVSCWLRLFLRKNNKCYKAINAHLWFMYCSHLSDFKLSGLFSYCDCLTCDPFVVLFELSSSVLLKVGARRLSAEGELWSFLCKPIPITWARSGTQGSLALLFRCHDVCLDLEVCLSLKVLAWYRRIRLK